MYVHSVGSYSYESRNNSMSARNWLINKAGYKLGDFRSDGKQLTALDAVMAAIGSCDRISDRPVFRYYNELSDKAQAKLFAEIETKAKEYEEAINQAKQRRLFNNIGETLRKINEVNASFLAKETDPKWYEKLESYRAEDQDALRMVQQAVELLKIAQNLVTSK